MLALGIRYLNGWAMATHPAGRNRAEWPPHPDRVFMALAAAHFESCDDPLTPTQAAEREALLWLEACPAPALSVSNYHEREAVTTFVPVNDTSNPLKGSGKNLKPLMPAGSLPIGRDRQPRQFPVAIPDDPVAYLSWDAEPTPELRSALDRLCPKVSRIGHSASLVQMWIADGEEPVTETDDRGRLVPTENVAAKHRLRVPVAGRLAELEARFQQGLRPTAPLWAGYSPPEEPEPEVSHGMTCFDPALLILRRVEGPALGLEATLQVTAALHKTVLNKCDPPPEWVSGHKPDRTPSEVDHLAFFPLPDVGHHHAAGHLLGVALAVPRTVPPEERGACFRKLLFDKSGQPQQVKVTLGRLGALTLQLEERESPPVALRADTWTDASTAEPARRWATVTPIALDRHPKLTAGEKADLGGLEPMQRKAREQAILAARVEEAIRRLCARIGLPESVAVLLTPVAMFQGAPHARSFPHLTRPRDGGKIHHTHAVLTFPTPVVGPVLLGTGRYRGYGLCRPLRAAGVPS